MLSSALVQPSTGFKKDALGKLILCYRLENESTLKTNSTKIIFYCCYCKNKKNTSFKDDNCVDQPISITFNYVLELLFSC